MAAFYQQFSSLEQVESAVEKGPNIIAIDTIETLKDAKEKGTKIGKHIAHMSEFNIHYIHSLLPKLGLVAWRPNLDEQPDSLYNKAHQICAIKSFRQLVAGLAYQYSARQ
jgi:hypothetical protein